MEGWTTVYVDLLGIVSADDFSARIERAYTQQLTGKLALWWAGVRRSLRPTVTAGGGPFPGSLSVDLSGPARDALLDRLDMPKKVFEKTGNRVYVAFDEFQELDQLVQRNIDQVVRSVIQHHGDAASYVFAGSEIHMMEMMFADKERAFFGQALKTDLLPLDDQPLGEYIVSRFEEHGKSLDADVLEALLGLVRGHPQRAMVTAHALWNATDVVADVENWEQARHDVMEEVDDELRTLWAATDTSQREVLALLVAGKSALSRAGGGARGGSRVAAVEALEAKGVIAKTPQDDDFIVDPLFVEWIRAQSSG